MVCRIGARLHCADTAREAGAVPAPPSCRTLCSGLERERELYTLTLPTHTLFLLCYSLVRNMSFCGSATRLKVAAVCPRALIGKRLAEREGVWPSLIFLPSVTRPARGATLCSACTIERCSAPVFHQKPGSRCCGCVTHSVERDARIPPPSWLSSWPLGQGLMVGRLWQKLQCELFKQDHTDKQASVRVCFVAQLAAPAKCLLLTKQQHLTRTVATASVPRLHPSFFPHPTRQSALNRRWRRTSSSSGWAHKHDDHSSPLPVRDVVHASVSTHVAAPSLWLGSLTRAAPVQTKSHLTDLPTLDPVVGCPAFTEYSSNILKAALQR